jgi:cation transport regulator ChaC
LERLAVFGYGSLVSPASAAESLGRPVELAGPARLQGWRRRWSTFRDNLSAEKTFAAPDGTLPRFVLGLNIEADPGCEGANGALIEVTEAEAARLDFREMRYARVDVTEAVRPLGSKPDLAPRFERVIAYVAKPAHHAPEPPAGAIVIAHYVRTVEAAFADLGDGQLVLYRETTDPAPVEAVEATLVRDEIPAGNPRAW